LFKRNQNTPESSYYFISSSRMLEPTSHRICGNVLLWFSILFCTISTFLSFVFLTSKCHIWGFSSDMKVDYATSYPISQKLEWLDRAHSNTRVIFSLHIFLTWLICQPSWMHHLNYTKILYFNFNLFSVHLIHIGYDPSDMELVNTEIRLQIYMK
jgi:hypothetical protein